MIHWYNNKIRSILNKKKETLERERERERKREREREREINNGKLYSYIFILEKIAVH